MRSLGRYAFPFALVLAACSHEAKRDNPFDPALTLPVEVEVALDDTAGTVRLTWTPYEGQFPFAAYWVLRNQTESTRVDTLNRLTDVGATAFVDTTLQPAASYSYRVSVVNSGGHEVPSAERTVAGYTIGPVTLVPPEPRPEAGSILLRWTRYRDPGFAGYRVQRREVGTDRVEQTASLAARADTAFADTTVRHAVVYTYTVLVEAHGQRLPSNPQEGALLLPTAEMSTLSFDSATGSATLTWAPYTGPRFRAYRVVQSAESEEPQTLFEIDDIAAASFTASGLNGNTEYRYRIVVVTQQGEQVEGQEQVGSFHPLLATWPLDLEAGEYVRLYDEPEDRIAALVAGPHRVRLLSFDMQGTLLQEQVLVNHPFEEIAPSSVATALLPDGSRVLSLSTTAAGPSWLKPRIYRFGPDGLPMRRETPVFADSLSQAPAEVSQSVSGEILVSGEGASFAFDDVRVSSGGQMLFSEDFEAGQPSDEWDQVEASGLHVDDGWALRVGLFNDRLALRKSNESWRDIRLEVDVALTLSSHLPGVRPVFSVRVGTARPDESSAILAAELPAELVRLSWWDGGQARRFVTPFPIVEGAVYGLGLGVVDKRFRAWIMDPVLWAGAVDEGSSLTSLVAVEEFLALTVGNQPHNLKVEGEVAEQAPFEETPLAFPVSETRVWQAPQSGQWWLGSCIPIGNQVRYVRQAARIAQGLAWPTGGVVFRLGSGAGQGPGEFFFPLSFDVGPDGRFFVLDAGNGRIQAFDRDGNYVTQWGRKGSGIGEFDFGSGAVPDDFAGSVAVDDQGSIYVADVGNRRIQKFAP